MKAVLLLITLVTIASCADIDVIRYSAQKVLNAARDTLKTVKRQTGASFSSSGDAACDSAAANLAAAYNGASCSTLATAADDLSYASSADQVYVDIQAFCTSTCVDDLISNLTVVAQLCYNISGAETVIDDWAVQLYEFRFAVNVICYTDASSNWTSSTSGEGYCAPVIWATVNALSQLSSSSAPELDALEAICVPCFEKYLVFVSQVSSGSGAATALYLGLLCLTDKDASGNVHYCAVDLAALDGGANFTDPTALNAELTTVCATRCLQKYGYYLATVAVYDVDVAASLSFFVTLADFLCSRDTNGQLCVPELGEVLSVVSGGSSTSTPNFNQLCTSFNTLYTTTPCCLNELLTFITNEADAAGATYTANYFWSAEISPLCSIYGQVTLPANPPGSCSFSSAATGTVTFSIVVSGVDQTWWNNNQATLETAVIADVAQSYGLSVSEVTLVSATFSSTTGDLTLTFTYTPATTSEGQSVSSNMNGSGNTNPANANGAVPFYAQTNIVGGVGYGNVNAAYATPAATTDKSGAATLAACGALAAAAVVVLAL